MAQAAQRTTANHVLMNCPACHQPIVARVAMDLIMGAIQEAPGHADAATVPVTATIKGLTVTHDCIPQNTRNPHPERTTP